MPRAFDAILIGAGPAAVAALAAAPEGLRIAVVTGAAPTPAARPHPKIAAVAYERREAPGLGPLSPFADGSPGGLYATAAEGGLAGYWGQQFVRYAPGDPWPADIFADHDDYLRACAAVEALFRLSPLQTPAVPLGEAYQRSTPRLLVGTTSAPDAQLLAMRDALHGLARARGAVLAPRRAVRFGADSDGVVVTLDDGAQITADRLILAAGVVGDLILTRASCPEVVAAGLADHAPFMLYTLGLDRLAPLRRDDGLRHFNAVTIERQEDERTRLFASVYRMSAAPLSLILAAAGLAPRLRGWPAPPGVDLVKPVQLWTELTQARLRIGADGRVTALAGPPPLAQDPEAAAFVGWLRANGVRVAVRGSEPGAGYHYHAGEVSTDREGAVPLGAFLDRRFSGRATCVDASALGAVGCRPHTLTAMAAAHRLSGRAWTG